MMISCEEARRLVSESQDLSLGIYDRLALGFHLLICKLCAAYEKQYSFLRAAMRSLLQEFSHLEHEALSESARERIQRKLAGRG